MESSAQTKSITYNKALADSLQADDYGMKSYFLVLLKTGSFSTNEKSVLDSLFRGHMENINRLASQGKLVVAGPVEKNDQRLRGIFIIQAASRTELDAMLQADAAIRANLFATEVFNWYGSAALPMYLPFHQQVERIKP